MIIPCWAPSCWQSPHTWLYIWFLSPEKIMTVLWIFDKTVGFKKVTSFFINQNETLKPLDQSKYSSSHANYHRCRECLRNFATGLNVLPFFCQLHEHLPQNWSFDVHFAARVYLSWFKSYGTNTENRKINRKTEKNITQITSFLQNWKNKQKGKYYCFVS